MLMPRIEVARFRRGRSGASRDRESAAAGAGTGGCVVAARAAPTVVGTRRHCRAIAVAVAVAVAGMILICLTALPVNRRPGGRPAGMRAVRKQAMDGLSGASLRRHRSCGLVPLQGKSTFLW